MYCKNCGNEIVGTGAFCQSCGARVEEASAIETGAPPIYSGTNSVQAKRGKRSLILILSGILVVALVLVVVFITHGFGLIQSKDDNPLAITVDAMKSYFYLSSVHIDGELIRYEGESTVTYGVDALFGDSYKSTIFIEDWKGEEAINGFVGDSRIAPWSYIGYLYNGSYGVKYGFYDLQLGTNAITYEYTEDVTELELPEWFSYYIIPAPILPDGYLENFASPWQYAVKDKHYNVSRSFTYSLAKYVSNETGGDVTDTPLYEAAYAQLLDWFEVFIYTECDISGVHSKYVLDFTKEKQGMLTHYEYNLDLEPFLGDMIEYIANSLNGRAGKDYDSIELREVIELLSNDGTVDGFVWQMRDKIAEKYQGCGLMHVTLTTDSKGVLLNFSTEMKKGTSTFYYHSLELSEHNSVVLDEARINRFIETAKMNASDEN